MEYKVVNGTSYHVDTPDAVIEILDKARIKDTRIRIFYGDRKTGRDWLDTYDNIGQIGRSSGPCKIPILLHTRSSLGGPGILCNHIIKITIDKQTVYRAPNYYLPELHIARNYDEATKAMGLQYCLEDDKGVVARYKTREQAEKAVAFYRGERNRI